MKTIQLDASSWREPQDFYDAIFAALGSPAWHGTSVNALAESMVWGEINQVEAPYRVQVVATKNLPADVMRELKWTVEDVLSAKADFKRRRGEEVNVSFEIVS